MTFPPSLPKRIVLRGADAYVEEGVAGGTIKPGHLIALGSAGTYAVHGSDGGVAEKTFAVEDALQGKTIDDNYSSGDRVSFVIAEPGDIIYALLKEGENASIGSKLSSAGDGTLEVTDSTDAVLAVAIEAVDASDTAGEGNERIRVRVL